MDFSDFKKAGEFFSDFKKAGEWFQLLKSDQLLAIENIIPGRSDQTDKSTVFNIVNSSEHGKWTVSEITKYSNNECKEKIPHIILTEYRITSSSALQSIRHAIGLIPDGIGTLDKFIPDALSNLVKSFIPDKLGGFLTSNTQKTLLQDIQPQIESDPNLAPYSWLYSVVPTGFSYIFPYFNESYFEIKNRWTDSSKDSPLFVGIENVINAGIDAIKGASFWDPGIYIERPKFYNFDSTNTLEIPIKFPLINTHKFEDVARNLEIIKNLVIQNLPYRINLVKNEIPVVYDVTIPGVAHYPFCYVKRLSIHHLGNKRLTTEFTDGVEILIPDAYIISITLETLTTDASNYYIQAFGKDLNGINVRTHLNTEATAATAATLPPLPRHISRKNYNNETK